MVFDIFKKIGCKVPEWIQGEGGNISFKEGHTLFIKPSGYKLQHINDKCDLSGVDLLEVRKALMNLMNSNQLNKDELYSKTISQFRTLNRELRPSMETGFHVLLEKKYVLHFHSIYSLIMSDLYFKQDKPFLSWIEGQNITPKFIDFFMPGFDLLRPLSNINSEIIFLKNHGTIIQTDSLELIDSYIKFENLFCNKFNFSEISHENIKKYVEKNKHKIEKGPLKIYYPDTAVFYEKFIQLLKKVNNSEYDGSDLETADKSLFEIWLATQVLYLNYPELDEVPETLIKKISQLDSEKQRIIQKEKRNNND